MEMNTNPDEPTLEEQYVFEKLAGKLRGAYLTEWDRSAREEILGTTVWRFLDDISEGYSLYGIEIIDMPFIEYIFWKNKYDPTRLGP